MTETSARAAPVELIVLRVLPTAVRCRSVGSSTPVTYRKTVPHAVPGQRLMVTPTRRWGFRRTEMIGGVLLHADFSLRALRESHFKTPTAMPEGGIRDPAEGDQRLTDTLLERKDGEWLTARCLLLEVLEEQPGSLLAHSASGEVYAELRQSESALAHFTAAIRLGLGARAQSVKSEGTTALVRALVGRARELAATGKKEAAAADLRAASRWSRDEFDNTHLSRMAPPGATTAGCRLHSSTKEADCGRTP